MAKLSLKKIALAKAQKRIALDNVLKCAMANVKGLNGDLHGKPGQPICLYDCAVWLLYACTRDEARVMAQDLVDEGSKDPEMQEEARRHTPAMEIETGIDCELENRGPHSIFTSQQDLAKELDPGYEQPILTQESWI